MNNPPNFIIDVFSKSFQRKTRQLADKRAVVLVLQSRLKENATKLIRMIGIIQGYELIGLLLWALFSLHSLTEQNEAIYRCKDFGTRENSV